MASKAAPESLKGYDHQFVDPPPDDLLCLICLSVARHPQILFACHRVCHTMMLAIACQTCPS